MNWYTFLKFVHVLSVVIWIGGLTGLSAAAWRIARERNRAALTTLLKQANVYGQRVVGPTAGLVVITGLAMVGIGHIGFGTFWVWFGYAAVVVQAVLGGFIIRKQTMELAKLAASPSGDDVALVAAARKLWNIQLVYLVLFAIIIAAMVIKPTP